MIYHHFSIIFPILRLHFCRRNPFFLIQWATGNRVTYPRHSTLLQTHSPALLPGACWFIHVLMEKIILYRSKQFTKIDSIDSCYESDHQLFCNPVKTMYQPKPTFHRNQNEITAFCGSPQTVWPLMLKWSPAVLRDEVFNTARVGRTNGFWPNCNGFMNCKWEEFGMFP